MLNLPPRLGTRLTGAQFANLHTFAVAARHLSFTLAAVELCLTPSAVSHRIARLEQALEVRLFERLTRRIRLTPEGERLYRLMQGLVEDLEEALQETSTVSGPLTLYARPSITQCWLVPRLADFQQRYPQISLDIRTGNEAVDFRARHIDLALLYGDGEYPGLVSQLLMAEQLAPVCSPQYAERHGLIDNPGQLRQCTLLHDALAWEHAAFDAEWQRWARGRGVQDCLPSAALTFDRSDLCAVAASNHVGVAMGRRQLVQPLIDQGLLVLPLGDFESVAGQGYYLVHPPREPMPLRIRVMIEWLLGGVV